MIHTKIHYMLEGLRNRSADKTLAPMLADVYEHTPHYVLTDDLMNVLDERAVQSTVRALMDADVARTPHQYALVEFNQSTTSGSRGRVFVWLSQEPIPNQWMAHLSFLHDDGRVVCMHKGALVTLRWPDETDVDKVAPEERDHMLDSSFAFEISPTQHSLDYPIAYALGTLLTLSHTKGVAKQDVTEGDLRKLNKARAAKAKQAILPYTVYKIGHTYNSKGERTTYAPGSKMVPHLRAGHVRRQRYGTGRSEIKTIFIEPVLVNCESINEVKFKPKVVMP